MKKSILTFAAIALIFSFSSCKETTVEQTEELEVMETETEEAPVEVIEEAPVEVMEDTITEEAAVEVQ
ncbi:hypothetical protein FK178_02020 [Antarcticibacterium arcticum]|uniref:Uncharacterized protein n=1 Tax=Antarcticibacterium arcticum TaxID=2585771 RepID=A0A5B8YFP1_9FLAO|nr:hypothetical protein [Antarcticibacterium arcticum]QED36564.1 hypothetical protein FK178_02020 [Antarcticibacterium arcticum]